MIKIQVSGIRESEKSIAALVDLKFNKFGDCSSAMTQVWFPKSICKFEEEEYLRNHFGKEIIAKKYFITAPKWFLDKNNITYEKM